VPTRTAHRSRLIARPFADGMLNKGPPRLFCGVVPFFAVRSAPGHGPCASACVWGQSGKGVTSAPKRQQSKGQTTDDLIVVCVPKKRIRKLDKWLMRKSDLTTDDHRRLPFVFAKLEN
jgi:hypothetical protein